MHYCRLALFSLASTTMLLSQYAAGQPNLLTNPVFDTGVSAWTGNSLTWDGALDANASPQSGSARALGGFWISPFLSYNVIAQCVGPIREGGVYLFGGRTFVATGQGSGDTRVLTSVWVKWYRGSGCAGLIAQHGTQLSETQGQWVDHRSAAVQAPSGAVSASVEGAAALGAPEAIYAHFDDMYFRAAETQVPALGPLGLSFLAVVLAVIGWGLLRSRY